MEIVEIQLAWDILQDVTRLATGQTNTKWLAHIAIDNNPALV